MPQRYNGSMVTLARESRGLTQTELASRISVPQGTISKIESGILLNSEEVVKKTAHALEFPESFFLQTDLVYPFGSSAFYHRKLQSLSATVLKRIEAKANIYRFQISRLLRSTDLDKRCKFRRVDIDEHHGRVEEVAQLTRAAWGLRSGPIENVINAIESAGGIVIRFDFGTSKLFGLSEWIPPAPPIFFLNDRPDISADRDRWTLAHEVGHILLHALPNARMEKEADAFAGEFLAPARDVRPHLQPPIRLHTVGQLKPYWRLSMAALIRRAFDLKIINHNQFVYLQIQLQQRGYRYREPAELDVPREQPSLLKEVIDAHVGALGYGYSELAQMLNVKPDEFMSAYQIANNPGGLRIVNPKYTA